MPWNYNPDALVSTLEEAGFDALVYDNVEAVKDDGETNQQVYINPGGKMRYQYSRQLSENSASEKILGKVLDIHREKRNIVNVVCELENSEELTKLLKSIPEILRKDDFNEN